MIGLFNYIPYVGSIVGVALPVILSLAQFGSLGTTALLGALLIAAQTYVGNILEPRVIGKQLNLSPFVVLVALAVWSSLWGLPGAILAIPLTAMVAIICDAFPQTRFVAVLLANEVEPTAHRRPPARRYCMTARPPHPYGQNQSLEDPEHDPTLPPSPPAVPRRLHAARGHHRRQHRPRDLRRRDGGLRGDRGRLDDPRPLRPRHRRPGRRIRPERGAGAAAKGGANAFVFDETPLGEPVYLVRGTGYRC